LDSFRRQVAGAHVGIFEVGVAGIDDEIALSKRGNKSLITESTGAPAGTSIMMARGLRSKAMNLLIFARRGCPGSPPPAQRRHFGASLS